MAQRITQPRLESYLWGAAILLRGTIDAGDYKQFIFPLLFYKRLCDVFDEETETARAEAMHRRALEVDKALGAKERMAGSYVNLGLVYQVRGDLAQAEGLYRKALELYKTVGDKKGTASSYANLAVLYGERGDLTQAEAMYRQALTLFQEIGATSFLEKVRAALDMLRVQGAP